MFDFTLEWTALRSPIARATDANAVTHHLGLRDTVLASLVLLVVFLTALGIMTGVHLRDRDGQASSHAAFAGMSVGMGFPVLYPSGNACRRPPGSGSASRLRHADVLALLAAE